MPYSGLGPITASISGPIAGPIAVHIRGGVRGGIEGGLWGRMGWFFYMVLPFGASYEPLGCPIVGCAL